MKIEEKEHRVLKSTMAQLRDNRLPFWNFWRELADYYLPKRYVWLQSDKERRVRNAKNPFILDGTGTSAARTLASGMMNGITSPSRPWFTIRIPGFSEASTNDAAIRWCDEVTRRMLLIMSESNFYNAMAVMYLDLVVFGTAAMLMYEDKDNVIRCFNPALGEYYLAQDDRLQVNTFAREFEYTVAQMVQRWGKENCSQTVRTLFESETGDKQKGFPISHLIQPNDGTLGVSKRFKFVETYWETAGPQGIILDRRGFNEMPGVFPRWELTANDSYGTSPSMDALGDVIQLQLETKRKAQGLDKAINPPVVADVQLKNKPTALMPNGVTYVAGVNNVGAKALYTVNPPLAEMTMDIRDVQARIRETFHNDLFRMISELDTVRSATEIDARKEEKLVLLGSVLERFENEALDPAINRLYAIMTRANLLPPVPEGFENVDLEIQYVSILSTAQRAVSAIPTERWIGLIGNIGAAVPEVLNIPDWDELIRSYGTDIGVPAKNMRTKEDVAAASEQEAANLAQQEQAVQGEVLVNSAKQLSETDIGGGTNALQAMLGG